MQNKLIAAGLGGLFLLVSAGCGRPSTPIAAGAVAAMHAVAPGSVTVHIRWPHFAGPAFKTQVIPDSTMLLRVSILSASGNQQASTDILRPDSQQAPLDTSTTLLLSEGTGYRVSVNAYRERQVTESSSPIAQGSATEVQVVSNHDTEVPVTLSATSVPVITSLSPSSGLIGELVTIGGAYFGATGNTSLQVTFNGVPAATLTRNSDTQIVAVVPMGASTGQVVVTADGVGSQTNVAFDVLSALVPETFFRYGVYTESPPSLGSNVTTDGYDSSLGTYGGTNVLQNAFTGSSISEPQPLPSIQPFTTGTTSHSGSGTMTPGAYDAITISGQRPATLSLGAGDYYVNTISATGRGVIVIDGAVKLYVDDALSLAGQAILNPSGIPANLQIFYAGTEPLLISGQAELYGVIFAPNAEVQFSGSGALYGAVVARSISATGNFAIHFDLALRSITG